MKKIFYSIHLKHVIAAAFIVTVAMAANASVNVWLKAPAGTNVYAAGNGNEPLGSWPGTALSNPNSDGWYQVTIEGCDEVPILIFNKDGNQTRNIINVKGTHYYVYNGYNFFADVSPARGAAAWLMFQPQSYDGSVTWFPTSITGVTYRYFTLNCPSTDENGNTIHNQLGGYITRCPDYDNNGKDVFLWTSTEPITEGTTVRFYSKDYSGASVFNGDGEPNPDESPFSGSVDNLYAKFSTKYYKGGFYEITGKNSGKESDTQYRGNVGPTADFTIRIRHQSTYDLEKVVNHYNNIIMIDDHGALGEEISGMSYAILRDGVEVATGILGDEAQVVDTYDESTLNGDRASRVFYELKIDNANGSFLSNTVSISLRKLVDRLNEKIFHAPITWMNTGEVIVGESFRIDELNAFLPSPKKAFPSEYKWCNFRNAPVLEDGTPNYRRINTYVGQNNSYQQAGNMLPQANTYSSNTSDNAVNNIISTVTDMNHFNYVWVTTYKNEYGDECTYGNKLRKYGYANLDVNDPSDPNNDTRMQSEETWIEDGQQVRGYSVTFTINGQSDDDLTTPYKIRVWRGKNRLGDGVLIDPENLVSGTDELGNEWGQTWTQGEALGQGKDLRNVVVRDYFVDKVLGNGQQLRRYYIIHYYAESMPNGNTTKATDDEQEINGEPVLCPEHYVGKEQVVIVYFTNDIPTGISSVVSEKEIASVKYVNIMGVESPTPFKGINIVVTTYSDGTTSKIKKII